jgi:hypothetical protein
MNERIRELAEQAELPVIDGMWDYNDREILRREDGEWRVATPAEIISLLFACEKGREKFAELIVQECADVGSKFSLAHPEAIRGQIKRHFGVE